MGRFLVIAMLATGCARVTEGSMSSPPDADSSGPPAFQFHLVVHVFGGNGVEISSTDGRASEHAFADFKFPDYSSMPEAGILPLMANGVTLSINTRGCPGSDVVYEHVILSGFQALDSEAVYGSIAYDCTYPDGTTMTVPATKVAFLGATGTPL